MSTNVMTQSFDGARFWQRFAQQSQRLFDMVFSDDIEEAYERITSLLEEVQCPYVSELTCNDDSAILIFTPESDRELAKEIDRFVQSAPVIPKWIILSRRQQKPVDDVFEILLEIYGLDARDATFSVRKQDEQFHIVMHTSVASEMSAREAAGFVDTFLEHALGEDFAMTHIRKKAIDSRFVNKALPADTFIALLLGAKNAE